MEETNTPRPRKEHRASWEENSDDFPDHLRFDSQTYWWEDEPAKVGPEEDDTTATPSQIYLFSQPGVTWIRNILGVAVIYSVFTAQEMTAFRQSDVF